MDPQDILSCTCLYLWEHRVMGDASPPANSESNSYQEQNQDMFDELRQLLLEPEREQLQQLEGRLERWRPDPHGLSRMLPEAFVRRPKPDPALGMALFPMIEEGLKQSVNKNPLVLVEAIAPVMIPAIRKAIAQALQGMMQSLNQALEYSISMQGWRWEGIRTGKPFAEVVMLHALLYRVESVKSPGVLAGRRCNCRLITCACSAILPPWTAARSCIK